MGARQATISHDCPNARLVRLILHVAWCLVPHLEHAFECWTELLCFRPFTDFGADAARVLHRGCNHALRARHQHAAQECGCQQPAGRSQEVCAGEARICQWHPSCFLLSFKQLSPRTSTAAVATVPCEVEARCQCAWLDYACLVRISRVAVGASLPP
jgi:hypothetical protein